MAADITSMSVALSSGTASYGTAGTVTYNVTVTPDGASGSKTFNLTVNGLPTGVTAVFKNAGTTVTTVTLGSGASANVALTLELSNVANAINPASNTYSLMVDATRSSVTKSSSSFNYVVAKKVLTVTGAAVTSKSYDGTNSATITGTLSGVLAGDAGNITLSGSGTFASVNVSNGIAVTSASSLAGTASGNYSLTQPTGLTGNITKSSLTITANNANKIYGEVLTSPVSGSTAFTLSGIATGETVGSITIAYSGSAATSATANVGTTGTITPSAATGGTFNINNYTVTYSNGTLTVVGAPLTITANNVIKLFGTTLNSPVPGSTAFTVSAGLKNGNTVSSVQITYPNSAPQNQGNNANSPIDIYPGRVTPSAASGANGFLASNYNINYVSGDLAVVSTAYYSGASNQVNPNFNIIDTTAVTLNSTIPSSASYYFDGNIKKLAFEYTLPATISLANVFTDKDANGLFNSGDATLVSGTDFTVSSLGGNKYRIVILASSLFVNTSVAYNLILRFSAGISSYDQLLFLAPQALPVTLTSFTVKPTTDNKVNLAWVTSSESSNKGFRIERQTETEGKFTTLAFVNSKAIGGNSQITLSYSFKDMNAIMGTNTYRLVQEDMDGKQTFSEVRMVKLNGQSIVTVYPNPTRGMVTISKTNDGKMMNVQIIDQSGRIINQYQNITDSNLRLNLPQSGIYQVKLTYPETGEQSIQRIVVQH
jgi:hypothetical protein